MLTLSDIEIRYGSIAAVRGIDLEVHEGDALEEEINAFVQAVRARQPPPVTGWDGLRALEVAAVIRESVETEVRAAQAARVG